MILAETPKPGRSEGRSKANELEKTAATVIGRITVIDAWRRIISVMTKAGITNSS